MPDLKQIAQAFLKGAGADLRSARLLLAGKEYSQTIVHCQHAAEKTLKAALALRHIIITRQHTVSPDFVAAFSDFAEANQLRKAWVVRCLELHRDRVGISRDIIERAGRLEADGITALDSLHLACAEVAGAEYFLTCDDRVMGRYGESEGPQSGGFCCVGGGGATMAVKIPREPEVLQEAADLLLRHMSPAKVARVLAAWQVGSGDYLITRERLFAGETVQTLAEKIQAFQDGEPSK